MNKYEQTTSAVQRTTYTDWGCVWVLAGFLLLAILVGSLLAFELYLIGLQQLVALVGLGAIGIPGSVLVLRRRARPSTPPPQIPERLTGKLPPIPHRWQGVPTRNPRYAVAIPLKYSAQDQFLDEAVDPRDLEYFVRRSMKFGNWTQAFWHQQDLPSGTRIRNFEDYDRLIQPLVAAGVIVGRSQGRTGAWIVHDLGEIFQRLELA